MDQQKRSIKFILNRITPNMGIKIAYFYLLLPIIIFFLGWMKWYISIPTTCVLLYSYFTMCRHAPLLWKPKWNRGVIEKCILITGIVFLWVYLSGIGGFVFQNSDHPYRNAIFETLVNNRWPIIETVRDDGISSTRGLVYYIGYWLPAAVFGKLFGTKAGYCMQALWAVIGILLFYYIFCAVRKKVSVWPLLVFIFFSGLDIVGYFITRSDLSDWSATLHLEWWASAFQFSSFTTQLFWVFNQALPAWLVIMLMYIQKSNRYLVLLLGISLLSSTLPFVGMLPFFVYFLFSRKYDSTSHLEWWKRFVQDTFRFENIVGGGLVGVISFLYLKSNFSAQVIGTISHKGGMRGYLLLYILFLILEVGVYLLAIYKYQRKKVLYYLAAAWLCICPLITVGFGKDFCMRASIPALLILCLFVIDTLSVSKKARDYLIFFSLTGLLLIGSVTPIHELMRTTIITSERYRCGQPILDTVITKEELLKNKNFSGETDRNFFFKYIAKPIY